jgi:hypothetical protein
MTALRAFTDLHAEWLTDPDYAADFERLGPIYEAAFSVAETRRKRGRKHEIGDNETLSDVSSNLDG